MQDLFSEHVIGQREELGPGALLLRGRALGAVPALLAAIEAVAAAAPFRRMTTPGGFEGFFRMLAQADQAGELGSAAYARASAQFGITWLS